MRAIVVKFLRDWPPLGGSLLTKIFNMLVQILKKGDRMTSGHSCCDLRSAVSPTAPWSDAAAPLAAS